MLLLKGATPICWAVVSYLMRFAARHWCTHLEKQTTYYWCAPAGVRASEPVTINISNSWLRRVEFSELQTWSSWFVVMIQFWFLWGIVLIVSYGGRKKNWVSCIDCKRESLITSRQRSQSKAWPRTGWDQKGAKRGRGAVDACGQRLLQRQLLLPLCLHAHWPS